MKHREAVRRASAMVVVLCAACTSPAVPPSDARDLRDGMDAIEPPPDVAMADQGTCVDMDNDGHPSAACGGDDCDDNNPRRNPSAREVCDAVGADEDCNPCTVGEVLPNNTGGDGDRDEDGFPSRACFNRLDPGATPMCAGEVRPADGGSDGGTFARITVSSTETRGTDCDDGSRSRSPAMSEVCDAAMLDENCNGASNERCACVTGQAVACTGTRGECARGMQDCIDGQLSMCSIAAVDETCDMRDNDCDGETDEGLRVACYRDTDSDGYSPVGTLVSQECGVLQPDGSRTCPGGYTSRAPTAGQIDCNDTNALQSPRLAEVPCNGLDDDCNAGTSDTSCAGGMSCTAGGCQCPSGQVLCAGRCQAVGVACTIGTGFCANTAGRTACTTTGGVQSVTCTGSPLTAPRWYPDCDGDSHGDPSATPSASCTTPTYSCGPAGTRPMVQTMTDCVGGDRDPTSYTGAPERCDAIDNNCNGRADETFFCAAGTARMENVVFAGTSQMCARACNAACSGHSGACFVAGPLDWIVDAVGFFFLAPGTTFGGDGSATFSGVYNDPRPFLTDTATRNFSLGTRYTVTLEYAMNAPTGSTATFSARNGAMVLGSVAMPSTSGARRTVSTSFALAGMGTSISTIIAQVDLQMGGTYSPLTIYRVTFLHAPADPYAF
ncbi:MAG: putative metal-binding motif-containing protein [Myxococcales bacterium]|nr:putative metal-binding motif-containing protein [Myxococcales bacterium]